MKFHKNIVNAVLRSLHEIFEENRYADKVIQQVLKGNPKWGARDRKFIAESTYEIVRWYRLIASTLPASSEKEYEKIFSVYCVMKGISSDESIKKKLEESKKIRKIRESVPDWLDSLGASELGEERWEKELSFLNQEAKVILRTNTLKVSKETLQKKLKENEIDTDLLPSHSDALVLKKRKNVFTSPAFKEGWFEVQDASSQLVAPFLQLKDGMRVIDACAGAGGKTLHISALMHNKGKIIALDTEQWKLEELKKRARRAGSSNIQTQIIDSDDIIRRMENSADRLLLDIPCSGLGVLKRNPDAKWKLSLEFIERMETLQQKILNDYSVMLKKNGIMVYSTCSILPSENEKQIEKILATCKNFELINERKVLPSEGFDGFYMASLQKKS